MVCTSKQFYLTDLKVGMWSLKKHHGCSGWSWAKSLLRGRRHHPAVMDQWGVDVRALSRASIPLSPQEYTWTQPSDLDSDSTQLGRIQALTLSLMCTIFVLYLIGRSQPATTTERPGEKPVYSASKWPKRERARERCWDKMNSEERGKCMLGAEKGQA